MKKLVLRDCVGKKSGQVQSSFKKNCSDFLTKKHAFSPYNSHTEKLIIVFHQKNNIYREQKCRRH